MASGHRTPKKGRGAASNANSRFDTTSFEIDGDFLDLQEDEGSQERTRFLRDTSKSVVTRNNSPDIPFDVSLNPYRGCEHGCSYCIGGDTPVLMADGSHRPISSLRPGDEIYGTVQRGHYRRFVRTEVLDHWSSIRRAYRLILADATEIIASADHRFLTERGWKHVSSHDSGRRPRARLTPNNRLLGTGRFASPPELNDSYRRGYLCGMIRGDGHLGVHSDARRTASKHHQFRLALTDADAIARTRVFLQYFGVETRAFVFSTATASRAGMSAIRTSSRSSFDAISEMIAWPEEDAKDWRKGFLAGIFDAEGSYRDGILRVHNTDDRIIEMTCSSLDEFGFVWRLESLRTQNGKNLRAIRVVGGLQAHLRFFHTTDPAISRKRCIEGQAIKNSVNLRVVKVEDLGVEVPMYDITTGTGDFIANGVVSHNCYARPTHEYLGYSAGLDFERIILVKEDAPQLLEKELRKPSWEPKVMAISGVTDPYQPIERKLRLTRACLEVALKFRQPVGIITKNHLVTRDIDILEELAKFDAVHVTLSVTTLNEELRRRMEPRTATGQRRIDAIRQLAAAGIPVSVNVAPVIPGLNDEEIPAILEAAADAGARGANFILVRLPGAVQPVFTEWLEEHYPDRKDKVLGRLAEVRNGRLDENRFGVRMRGEGAYFESISALFHVHRKRLGLEKRRFNVTGEHFRVPGSSSQPGLFGE